MKPQFSPTCPRLREQLSAYLAAAILPRLDPYGHVPSVHLVFSAVWTFGYNKRQLGGAAFGVANLEFLALRIV